MRLQRKPEKFFDFPMHFLVVVFELLRNAGKGPFNIGGREVKSMPIDIGCFCREALCVRANNAPVDDKLVQFRIGDSVRDSRLVLTEMVSSALRKLASLPSGKRTRYTLSREVHVRQIPRGGYDGSRPCSVGNDQVHLSGTRGTSSEYRALELRIFRRCRGRTPSKEIQPRCSVAHLQAAATALSLIESGGEQ